VNGSATPIVYIPTPISALVIGRGERAIVKQALATGGAESLNTSAKRIIHLFPPSGEV